MNLPDNYHPKILADIHEAIKRIYADSFTVDSYVDGVLKIIGYPDVLYHPYEVSNCLNDNCITIRFLEVSYISLPTYCFHHPIFRLATTPKIAEVRKLVDINSDEIVYCIEAETTKSNEKFSFFLVAEGISF